MMHCPCGTKKDYSECCGAYIEGTKVPPSPEALMRSRYTAFSSSNMDYIASTMKGTAAKDFDPVDAGSWSKKAKWLGLNIVNASPLQDNGTKGYVEFIANFRLEGREQRIHEVSEFKLQDGRWYYIDGQLVSPPTQHRSQAKIGRNDPCSCGSGKKYKKCCGVGDAGDIS